MQDQYLTVSALTKYIKRKFETDPHLTDIWLKGEISNFKHHSRGHMYLTIKDNKSRVNAVMFAGNNRRLKFKPEDGMNVLIKGEIGVYEPHGQYQLYIQHMEPDGLGALYLAYEELKKKLSKEGLFEDSRKLPLPPYPESIAVITSPTGAAVRDILTTIERRYPLVNVTVFPVLVQGKSAAPSISQAIKQVNEIGDYDVIIAGRGGGSIEELWAFNEEVVARAIAESTIPIISAVGHETDFTISDFVADYRAPTPTGAAEVAVPSQAEVLERVNSMRSRLSRALQVQHRQGRDQLTRLQKSYAFRYPEQLMRQKEQDLDRLSERLKKSSTMLQERRRQDFNVYMNRLRQQHPERSLDVAKQTFIQLTKRMNRAMQQEKRAKDNQYVQMLNKLSLLNPLEIMKRGYAIPFDQEGSVVKSIGDVQPGDPLQVKVQDGVLDCQVWGMEKEEDHE
ncbi:MULTISPECIES: exodeoxyribonuclease VII large subunit [Pontibacillus]|uniref:Exodeoxyribonuclease 7 large subunit n=1 Tax=Pontibacillus chungwhensis TaxID=265426 RepID=A0ABY8UT85_9BACI|nr:exodeoxyribonuclease VII large subunit [Pontibacillus chungwhensis]MCD5323513.1 exodeoxyribonuclease VII large subunit [Pontibacillus sp. HN14]WIF96885.1 exodeoxyribonuclease VII large subunit [Pontibacillus chungwhensis]